MASGSRAPPAQGASRSELPATLAEHIRAADSKSPAELAALALEVKDAMRDLSDVEPEIREMLLRRQRAIAMKDCPAPPRTPELLEPEKPAPILRHCCCGCGAMLLCDSGMGDSAMTVMCKRQLLDPAPPPPVSASAQRAYCEQLARRKPAVTKSEEVKAPGRPLRLPDFGRLQQMAKPRELPPPPPPAPSEQVFRALPTLTSSRPSKSLAALKSSSSALDLRPPPCNGNRDENNVLASRVSRSYPTTPPPQLPPSDGTCSKLVELRYHAFKAKCSLPSLQRSPAASHSLPLLPPLLGDDFRGELRFERNPERKRHVSASSQRQYTEERLYRKTKNGVPGSTADLLARLEALKKENAASRKEEQLERERPNRLSHHKMSQHKAWKAAVAEIS